MDPLAYAIFLLESIVIGWSLGAVLNYYLEPWFMELRVQKLRKNEGPLCVIPCISGKLAWSVR